MSVPTWQPDEEATECPICEKPFTIFYRRHHCRKCGRVVCGSCSDNAKSYLLGTYVVVPPSQVFLESPHIPHRTCDECVIELDMISNAINEHHSPFSGPRYRNNLYYSSFEVSKPQSTKAREATIPVEDDSDFCPVCNMRISAMFEGDKEAHIEQCIERNQFSGSPEISRSPNRMLVYRLAKDFSGFKVKKSHRVEQKKPRQDSIAEYNMSFDSGIGSLHEQLESVIDEPPRDNTSDQSSNDAVECCICLEEFLPGDKVGRLECLCVFHYKCITDWFAKKGPGECPVHAVHS